MIVKVKMLMKTPKVCFTVRTRDVFGIPTSYTNYYSGSVFLLCSMDAEHAYGWYVRDPKYGAPPLLSFARWQFEDQSAYYSFPLIEGDDKNEGQDYGNDYQRNRQTRTGR